MWCDRAVQGTSCPNSPEGLLPRSTCATENNSPERIDRLRVRPARGRAAARRHGCRSVVGEHPILPLSPQKTGPLLASAFRGEYHRNRWLFSRAVSNPVPAANRGRSGMQPQGEKMARKVLNRKQLRAESEAAEAKSATRSRKTSPGKKTSRGKSRSKSGNPGTGEVRLKAYWGVFSQSMTAVALFEYSQRKEADKKARELTQSRRSPHFVQLVKRVIEE